MAYTINANAKNVWIRDNENTRDLSIQTDASSVYLDNGRTLEQELGEGSMVSNVATVGSAMSKVVDGTYDGAYESCVFKGRSLVNAIKNYSRSGYGSLSGSIALLDSGWIRATATSSNNHFELKMDNLNIKPSTKYMYILECRSNTFSGNGQTFQFGDTYKSHVDTPWTAPHIVRELPLGRYTFILTTKSDFSTLNNPVGDRSYICVGNGQIEFRYMILEYQEGMENWDIPFFTGLCDSKMPILRNVGKNLFDKQRHSNPNNFVVNPSYWSIPIQLKGNTLYNFSYTYGNVYNNQAVLRFATDIWRNPTHSSPPYNLVEVFNRNITSNLVGRRESARFTTPANGLVYLHYYNGELGNSLSSFNIMSWYTHLLKDVQLEEASSATSYEDHKTNILRTSEEIVLREVNGVQDTYNPLTGEYIKRTGEIVLNGSQQVMRDGSLLYFALKDVPENNFSISDRLPSITVGQIIDGVTGVGVQDRGTSGRLYINIGDLSTEEEITQYLQNTPVTVQYKLAKPVTSIVKPSTMTPFAYQNGHVIVESGFEGQSLLPTLEYSTVVNRTGQVESVAKTIQTQEKQLTMLEQMLIQNIIGLDYSNTVLALNLEINEVM